MSSRSSPTLYNTTSLQVSPSDTAVESDSGLEQPRPFFDPVPSTYASSPTNNEDNRHSNNDEDDDVQSIRSDTAVVLSSGKLNRPNDDDSERGEIETNARRIPARKVHWPSQRTMEQQFHPTSIVQPHASTSGSVSSRRRTNRRIEKEGQEKEDRSRRARKSAKDMITDGNRTNIDLERFGDSSGSETALSDGEEDERDLRRRGRGEPQRDGDYARRVSRNAEGLREKESESRQRWNERDLGDLSMDPDTRERQLRRRQQQYRQGKPNEGSRSHSNRQDWTRDDETSDSGSSDDGSSSSDDEGVDRVSSGGLGGIFTSVFGMSVREQRKKRKDDDQDAAEKGEQRTRGGRKRDKTKSLRKRSKEKIAKRRRWSHHALFRRDSASSLRSGRSSFSSWTGGHSRSRENSDAGSESRGGAGVLESEQGAREDADANLATSEDPNNPEVQETGRSEDTERANAGEDDSPRSSLGDEELYEPHMLAPVKSGQSAASSLRSRGIETDHHRARREMKEDLNSPYIPSTRINKADAVAPGSRIEAAQGWKTAIDSVKVFFRGGEDQDVVDHTGQYRSFAALIIATQGLTGVASPALARVAPASGKQAETNKGQRKLSEYSNPREKFTDSVKEINTELIQQAQEDGKKLTKKLKGRLAERAIQDADQKRGEKPMRGRRNQKEIRISRHPAELMQRQDFVVSLAKALISFGAPTHSVESWLEATSDVLGVQSSFLYLPAILILAFRDDEARSSDVLLLRPTGALDLYRLSLVHKVYRMVAHDVISVNSGARALRRIMRKSRSYHWTILMTAGFFISACGSIVAFSGSFVDGLVSGAVGLILNGVILGLLSRHKVMSNIFELTAAGVIAFIARGLGATGYFCYSSIVSAAIIIILPGWAICLGALELGSRNVAAGAIRIVFAIVFTLFLSFAISIGTQIMDATGVPQPSTASADSDGAMLTSQTVMGSFTSNNTAFDNLFQNGTFTFTNGTSTSASTGQVSCYRDPAYAQWWYNTPPDWSLFITVPTFAFALAMWFKQDWKSRDMVVSTGVASIGYLVNYWVQPQLPERSDISSAVQAFTVGILGNMYSRIARGSAFPSMVVGILLAVPNAVAAAGGLAQASDGGSDSSGSSEAQLSSTVIIAIRMIQTAIGLAIGLFAAAVVVYPFGKRGYIFAF